MLTDADIVNAAGEGIISSSQAERLIAYSKQLRISGDSPLVQELESRDEPFRLLRGFRDIFMAIGVLFLSIGATATVAQFIHISRSSILERGDLSPDLALSVFLSGAALAGFGIGLAEIVTRRLRLPLASLVLSMAVALWFGWAGFGLAGLTGFFDNRSVAAERTVLAFSASAFIGVGFFYYRYRLPFVAAAIALTAMAFAGAALEAIVPGIFKTHPRLLAGGFGVCAFAAAMAFDFRDRLRIARFSECGFWLHLVAAPMMVHAALATDDFGKIEPLYVFLSFAVLTVVALLIDRRAMLVSALIYLSAAFYRILSAFELSDSLKVFVPMTIIGVTVLALGVGWQPLRRLVFAFVPFAALKNRLPPVYGGSLAEMKA